MNRLFLLIILTLLGTYESNAQYNIQFGSANECYSKTFTIIAWVLTDTSNAANFSQSQLIDAIEGVNDEFSEMCVNFKLCDFNILPNHRQDTIKKGIHDEEISALYRKKNVINLYFVKEIIDDGPDPGPCGYAPLGSTTEPNDTNKRDAIFLKKSCFTKDVLAHELGHFFGLYHTFETASFGVEFIDGSNCATAGDLICDTQADPKGLNDGNCHLSPQDSSLGRFYEPPVCNIMSYYNPSCDQFFTREQLNRMLMIMKTGRGYLW